MTPVVDMSDTNKPVHFHGTLWCLDPLGSPARNRNFPLHYKEDDHGLRKRKSLAQRHQAERTVDFFKWEQVLPIPVCAPLCNATTVPSIRGWSLSLSTLWIWAWTCDTPGRSLKVPEHWSLSSPAAGNTEIPQGGAHASLPDDERLGRESQPC